MYKYSKVKYFLTVPNGTLEGYNFVTCASCIFKNSLLPNAFCVFDSAKAKKLISVSTIHYRQPHTFLPHIMKKGTQQALTKCGQIVDLLL